MVIEHRMDLMMSVCDTIFVLDFGKLIAAGTPGQVQADPAVTAAYLGAEENGPQKNGADGDLGRTDRRSGEPGAGKREPRRPGRRGMTDPASKDTSSRTPGRWPLKASWPDTAG